MHSQATILSFVSRGVLMAETLADRPAYRNTFLNAAALHLLKPSMSRLVRRRTGSRWTSLAQTAGCCRWQDCSTPV